MTDRCLCNDLDALFIDTYRASQAVSGATFPGDSTPLLTRHLMYQ